MRIWPAIDLKDGKCVRLSQGDLKRETVYGSSPADMALRWTSEGATGLHVIDLDGAMGRPANINAIASIAEETNVDLQVGGGIRDERAIEDLLALGIKRLIVSTLSISDPDWLAKMADRYPGLLLVSLDARNGKIAFDGWQRTSSISVMEHAAHVSQLPLAGLIYTNIDRAGMMSGPDFEAITDIRDRCQLPLTASAGVKTIEQLQQLRDTRVDGCVIGKALYDGHLTLHNAIQEISSIDSAH